MFINKISLYNFRVYYGNNELDLSTDINNNISVIAGNNGFGKTSFLTSLVWGLYGKLMSDVDERYKRAPFLFLSTCKFGPLFSIWGIYRVDSFKNISTCKRNDRLIVFYTALYTAGAGLGQAPQISI